MTEENGTNLRVAVVGAGVAGITAAHLLQRRHQVTLYEKNDYVGGHTHTIEVPDGPDRGLPVDTGFIVLNDRTYPLLHRLLAQLGVGVRDTEMSFSFQSAATGLEYAGTGLNGLFAQRRNLVRPAHWRLLLEVARFCRTARADLAENRLGRATLHEYLARGGYHRDMVDHYLVPMASAIWSTPPARSPVFLPSRSCASSTTTACCRRSTAPAGRPWWAAVTPTSRRSSPASAVWSAPGRPSRASAAETVW